MNLLASAYIWITGPYQVVQLAINIYSADSMPIDYVAMRLLFDLLGIAYGVKVKDVYFWMFCVVVSIEYLIILIQNI